MDATKEKLERGRGRLTAQLAAFGARLWAKVRAWDGAVPEGAEPAPVISLATHARRRYPRGRTRYERRTSASVIPMWLYQSRPRLETR